MAKFDNVVNDVIKKSNILIEVLDARFIDKTRNKYLENRVKTQHKELIHVLSKCDLVNKDILEKRKKNLSNCVFISSKEHYGTTMLRQKIKQIANTKKIKDPIIGVFGYPNVGKSSLINALKGKKSARTSSIAGFTTGKQLLKIDNDFHMLDSPGVVKFDDEEDLVLIAAENPHDIEDPDLAVMKLMEDHPDFFEKMYGVMAYEDFEDALEAIAVKLNYVKKGNKPDINRVAVKILQDWAKATLEHPTD